MGFRRSSSENFCCNWATEPARLRTRSSAKGVLPPWTSPSASLCQRRKGCSVTATAVGRMSGPCSLRKSRAQKDTSEHWATRRALPLQAKRRLVAAHCRTRCKTCAGSHASGRLSSGASGSGTQLPSLH